MKILILQDDFPPYEQGGAGVMSSLMARGMVAMGHKVSVITAVQKKELVGRFSENGMTIFRVYSSYHERWRSYISLRNGSVIPRIREVFEEVKPDVVHAHNIHYHISYSALKIARRYTENVFLTAHDIMPFYQGSFTEFINKKDLSIPTIFNYKVTPRMLFRAFKKRYNPFHNLIVRHYLSHVKKIIAVSNALKDALNQNGIKNVEVIHNGINPASWVVSEEKARAFKERYNLHGSKVVFFGGRLSGAKGGDLILQAMKLLVEKYPDTKLLVAGRMDDYAKRMERRAVELGIKSNVVFAGWLHGEIEKAYAASDVITIPSVCFDSFPNGNLEAFASGKPVVSTCFGGSREIVKDGENGFIVNPFDVKNMAQKISSILEDSEKARSFGENGKTLVQSNFSAEKMLGNYLDLFENKFRAKE